MWKIMVAVYAVCRLRIHTVTDARLYIVAKCGTDV